MPSQHSFGASWVRHGLSWYLTHSKSHELNTAVPRPPVVSVTIVYRLFMLLAQTKHEKKLTECPWKAGTLDLSSLRCSLSHFVLSWNTSQSAFRQGLQVPSPLLPTASGVCRRHLEPQLLVKSPSASATHLSREEQQQHRTCWLSVTAKAGVGVSGWQVHSEQTANSVSMPPEKSHTPKSGKH